MSTGTGFPHHDQGLHARSLHRTPHRGSSARSLHACSPGLPVCPRTQHQEATQNSTWFRQTRGAGSCPPSSLARRPSCVHSERLACALDTRVLASPHRAEQASVVGGTGRRETPLPAPGTQRCPGVLPTRCPRPRPPGRSAPAEARRTERGSRRGLRPLPTPAGPRGGPACRHSA